MGHLTRTIQSLFEDLKSGKTVLTRQVAQTLEPELRAVRFFEDGSVDISSCSPSLRSYARAYSLGMRALSDTESEDREASGFQESETRSARRLTPDDIQTLNRELFQHFDEVFRNLTGAPPERFVKSGETFSSSIRKLGTRLSASPAKAERLLQRGLDSLNNLQRHYAESLDIRLRAARDMPGLKLVMGGAQAFSNASLQATRSMLLYSDCILIPDSVHRWFESEGEPFGEGFPKVRMLQDIFHLSKLRPLVEADLPGPAIVVFPSYEKLFEKGDESTKIGIERLANDVFGWALGNRFDDQSEIVSYLRESPSDFLSCIREKDLFVPMGGEPGQDLAAQIAQQRSEIARIRSRDFVDGTKRMSDAELVWLTIMERLGPQFHVTDNADSLGACPLFPLEVHWHYYRLCHEARSSALAEDGQLSNRTMSIVESLLTTDLAWLGNTSIDDAVRLRQEFANQEFRDKLHSYVSQLTESSPGELDNTISEVSLAIQRLLNEHSREARKIDHEFSKRRAKMLVSLLLSVGASFLPWLPAVLPPIAATASAGKLITDEIERLMEKRTIGNSLMGVLAASAKTR